MLAIDNSQVRTFLECQRKFQYRYLWDLSAGMGSWLVTGRAWGNAQDVIWTGGAGKEVLEAAIARFEATVEEELPRLGEESLADWRIVSRHHYHEALADYLSTYQIFICETFDPTRTICEQPFEAELMDANEDPFLLTGRLDKVVFNTAEQNWWIAEHKTTAMNLSNVWLNKWKNDNQIRTYGWVGNALWGREFGGVLVDCASIARRGKIDLKMLPITFPPLAGSCWEEDMREIARSVADLKHGYTRCVKNTDACERFNRLCEYFEACSIEVDPRVSPEGWGLTVEHWDPREHAQRPGCAKTVRIVAGGPAKI